MFLRLCAALLAAVFVLTTGPASAAPFYPPIFAQSPSALAGLTAKPGSAATFMRSDAAPAIDQTISPVWTGTHDFTGGTIKVPTQSSNDNSTAAASDAFVQTLVGNVSGSATNASNLTTGTLNGARLAGPSTSVLGGVFAGTAASHQFLTAIGTSGALTFAQPAFTDISGTAALAQGGTGGTTASGARGNLGAAASGANSDITSIAGLTTPLTAAQGGTGATSVTAGLPQFTGPCGTATSGTATFNCNTLLGTGNTWAPQTFTGLTKIYADSGQSGSTTRASIIFDGANNGNSPFGLKISGYITQNVGGGFFLSTENGGTVQDAIQCAANAPCKALIAIPPASADVTIDTTANSQNRLSRVANMAAVAGWANTGFPVEVDGTTTAGDGGRRKMVFDSANLCGAGGHPAADGGTCVNSTVVTTGSWNIDWASVNFTATPQLFPKGSDDTSRIQAAIATGRKVYLPGSGTSATMFYYVSSDITLTTTAQIIDSEGRDRVYVEATAPGGFSKGVFVAATGLSEQKLRNFSVLPAQTANPTSASQLVTYVPMFYFEENPAFELEHMGCYQATVCVDMQGNGGQALISDFNFNSFKTGIIIDGSSDRVRIRDPHWYPFTMSTAQQSLFYANSVGIQAGRVDGFDLVGGLFFGGQAINFFTGTRTQSNEAGPPFGNISNTDFDNYNGIAMQSSTGTITCASCTFTAGSGQQPITQTAGNLTLVGSNVANANTASNGLVSISGGVFTATGTLFDTTTIDTRAIQGTAGNIILSGDTFNRSSSVSNYNADTIYINGARLMMAGSYLSDRAASFTGSACGINVATDNASRVIGNNRLLWDVCVAGTKNPNSLTGTSGGGVYAGN